MPLEPYFHLTKTSIETSNGILHTAFQTVVIARSTFHKTLV
ncbi:hypothetical protein J2S78_002977 [Salibacterium salarium]|nr:hypothetical protein [Salibacterium salarium]MDQ0300509.1 hypothetical protein [Salibacterium salarium]